MSITLRSGSIYSTEMVEAENLDLVLEVTNFQDFSISFKFASSKSHAGAVTTWRWSRPKTSISLLMVGAIAPRENVRGSIFGFTCGPVWNM